MASNTLTIRAIHPAGRTITFGLLGDADLTRSGGGGWQVVDRPRRKATTQWLDSSPFTMTMDLILDGIDGHRVGSPRSVDADCGVVEAWEAPATATIQPPVVKVTGPVPHTDLQWVVRSLDWKAAIRHPKNGHRIQQTVSITLLEYVPTTIVITGRSPARAAQQRQSTSSKPSGRKYTVRRGDTLSGIAARVLGDHRRWTEIATLNKIRDPNKIRVGQVLALPS